MRTTGNVMVVIMIGIIMIGVSPVVTLRVLARKPAIMVGTLAKTLLVLVGTLTSMPVVTVPMDGHHPMRVKIMTRPITRTTLKIMIGRMETSTPRMKIALKVLI